MSLLDIALIIVATLVIYVAIDGPTLWWNRTQRFFTKVWVTRGKSVVASATKKRRVKIPWWILALIGVLVVLWYFQPETPTPPPPETKEATEKIAKDTVSFWWIFVVALGIPILLGTLVGVVYFGTRAIPFLHKKPWGKYSARLLLPLLRPLLWVAALGMMGVATWLLLGHLLPPEVWGKVKVYAEGQYFWPLVLLFGGMLLFLLVSKPSVSGLGSLTGSILGIAVILVILFFGGKLAYQAYEGSSKKAEMVWPWTGEEVVVYAASTEGVRIPLGYEGQKIIATAEKTLFDRVGGDRKKVIISTKGRFCYAVTSDHAYPQKAHDWFIRLRYQGVTDQEVPPSPNPARGFKFENMVWQERIGYTELLYRGDVPGQLYIFVPRNNGCSP